MKKPDKKKAEPRIKIRTPGLWFSAKAAKKAVASTPKSAPAASPTKAKKPTGKTAEKPAAPVKKSVAKPASKMSKSAQKPSKPDKKPAAKPAPKPDRKPAAKPAPKPVKKPAAKPAPKPVKKPATKPAPKPDKKPAPKPAPKPDKKPATKPAPKPDKKPATKPAPKPDRKPAPKPDKKTARKTDKKSAPKPAPEPPKPAPEPPKPAPEPAPEPVREEPVQKAESKAEPEQSVDLGDIVPLVPTPEHDDWFDGPLDDVEDAAASFSPEDLAAFRENLLEMRTRLTKKASSLQGQSLFRHDEVNPEEDGTDASMRNTELVKAALDEDSIRQIDAALLAIDNGTYGICAACGRRIGKKRLEAQPFAKHCIDCQSEMEADAALRRSAEAAEFFE